MSWVELNTGEDLTKREREHQSSPQAQQRVESREETYSADLGCFRGAGRRGGVGEDLEGGGGRWGGVGELVGLSAFWKGLLGLNIQRNE